MKQVFGFISYFREIQNLTFGTELVSPFVDEGELTS
jgi:hypothetical protein